MNFSEECSLFGIIHIGGLIEKSFKAGFHKSAEGYNGEYGCEDGELDKMAKEYVEECKCNNGAQR